MIVGIEGGLGSGKTLLMVRYLVKDSLQDKPIFANFGLKRIKYNPLDIMDILKMDKEEVNLTNMSIAIDEITVFADCRASMSKMNKLISYFILQTRKRNVTFYYTTQDITMVDKRLEHHTDIRVCAEKIYHKNKKKETVELENYRKYMIIDLRNHRKPIWNTFVLDISKYFNFYDTDEIILPPV